MRASLLPAVLLTSVLARGGENPPPCGVSEDYFVPTNDGHQVHLHRHAAAGPPVLVVHGISSNHYCWDLDQERSLGVYLARNGYDAWLLDLRGHGEARNPPGGRSLWGDWSVDDYATSDVPAAISFVRQATGAPRVGYVGHSLGGIIGAIYASRSGDDQLTALIAVGSPVDFRDPDPIFALTRQSFLLGGTLLPFVVTPTLARVLDATAAALPFLPEELLYNPHNMDRDAARRMMATVVSPLWRGEMSHFSRMMGEEAFQSADGTEDYTTAMARIHVPVLVIAGRADRVAPPDRVKAYADAVGSLDRRFVVAGLENGFQDDYGHLDLPLGDHAAEEIYPLILDWLKTHP